MILYRRKGGIANEGKIILVNLHEEKHFNIRQAMKFNDWFT